MKLFSFNDSHGDAEALKRTFKGEGEDDSCIVYEVGRL